MMLRNWIPFSFDSSSEGLFAAGMRYIEGIPMKSSRLFMKMLDEGKLQ
jgi:hypothetical protein